VEFVGDSSPREVMYSNGQHIEETDLELASKVETWSDIYQLPQVPRILRIWDSPPVGDFYRAQIDFVLRHIRMKPGLSVSSCNLGAIFKELVGKCL